MLFGVSKFIMVYIKLNTYNQIYSFLFSLSLFTHLLLSFSHQRQLMVFYWRLSDSKSPQIYRTLLSILSVLNNVVVWMVSTRPPTSKSSSPFSNPLVIVQKVPITIGIIVTCMFHSFFNSLTRSRYLSFFSHSFSFILWSAGIAKSTILQVLFFCWLLLLLLFTPLEFFTSVLALGFSLEFEWQQVYSSLQDSS